MKDIAATLRRIDEEINRHRNEIARHRVAIGQLEDTRLVFMGMAEADQAAHAAAAEPELLAPGSHARPQLIVRPTTGNGDINGKPHKPNGKKRGENAQGHMRQRIINLLSEGGGPMTPSEIANNLGLPKGQKSLKPLANCLYNMRKKGILDIIGGGGPGTRDGRYALTASR